MEERLWRGDLEEKNGFSREGVNRSLQDTAPGPAGLHPGVCLQDSLFNTDGRAPGLAPGSLVPAGAASGLSVWVYREASWWSPRLLLVELPGRPSRSGRRCGATGEGALTSRRGEVKRVPHSQRGTKRRPGEQPGPNISSSSFGWALGCWRPRGVEGDLMLGWCLRQEQSELGKGSDSEF